jgi:hypothetical protein
MLRQEIASGIRLRVAGEERRRTASCVRLRAGRHACGPVPYWGTTTVVSRRRLDPLASLERVVQPQQGLLGDVLGLGDAAEHPVRDRERRRAELVEEFVVRRRQAATSENASRQLG